MRSKMFTVKLGRLANNTKVFLDGEDITEKLGVTRLLVDIKSCDKAILFVECNAERINIESDEVNISVNKDERLENLVRQWVNAKDENQRAAYAEAIEDCIEELDK